MDNAVIKTAGRVFEVLEYLREVRRYVSVREVAEQLGYPLSSTQVLMKSIATLGYLRYDSRHRAYFATPMLARLGDWVLDRIDSGSSLFQTLEAVARQIGMTAILAVENDIYAQYVHVVMARNALQFNVQPGTRRVLCMSGLGWALLAVRSDDEIARVVQRTQSRLARGGQQVDPEDVARHIRETREQGYAFSRGVVTEGVGIVGIALPPGAAGERLAIGVAGSLPQLEARLPEIVESLRRLLQPVQSGRLQTQPV